MKENKIWVSDSLYRTPIFFAERKDRQLYLCIDFCTLNINTVLDFYPLPCIEELLSWVKGAKYFLYMDLRDGYFHIPIAKEDVYKTTFSYKFGIFEYLIISLGLMNASSIF